MSGKKTTTDYLVPMGKTILKRMKPKHAFTRLKEGNLRYTGKIKPNQPRIRERGHERNSFIDATVKANNQYPFAIVLSCVDSRIPTEVIFDQEIGDIFNARIAGNFVNEDILGSMEFACGRPTFTVNPDKENRTGAKLILVLGHTSCGAIAAACSEVYPKTAEDNSNAEVKVEEAITPLPNPDNLIQLVTSVALRKYFLV